MHKLSNLRFFLIISLLLFSFFSCNDSTNTFPYVRIDLTISIDTQLGNMNVGEHRFIDNAGYGGLVIYRKSLNEYQAFDRACTHDYVDSCILKDYKDFDGILVCPCCNSKFLLSQSGSVFKAPATIPLEEYNTYLQGNFLRVSN